MNSRPPPLNALRAFEAAARHLSFKRAADELAVTPTAISHQIRSLENVLGFSLFHRLTRSLALTPQGQAMLPKVQDGLRAFAGAVEAAQLGAYVGRLRIEAPPAFAARWLIRHLPRFTERHPEVRLHLASSLTTVDARDGRQVVPPQASERRDETPVFIRFGHGNYPGQLSDRLFSPVYVPVCSPTFLNRHRLYAPSDLAACTLLHDDTIPDLMDRPSWQEWLRLAGVPELDADGGIHFSDPTLALAAAADGVGVALASVPLIEAEVAAGRLVMLFETALLRPQAYYFTVPEALAERPVVQLFREWLLGEVTHAEIGLRSPYRSQTGSR